MQDGVHSLLFRVVRGEATVTGTTITVGMGEPGTVVQTRNISATVNENGNVTANPFFLTDGSDWQVGVPFETGSSGQVIYPRLLTAKQGATVTFYLNSTSAFAMYGSVDYNQGIYNVTVTPPPAFMSAQATQYNASSHWMELDQIKCLVTGMNRSLTYRVDVTNESDNFFDFANLVVFDTPPASSPSPASSAPGSSATTSLGHSTSRLSSHSLGTGAILGIAVGSVLVFLAVAAMLFVLIRWQRRKRQIDIEEEVDHLIVSPYRLSSGNFVPIDHCVAPGNEASRARFPHFSKGHATVPGLSTNRLGEVPASSQTDIRQYESSAPSMPSAPVQPPSGSHEVIHEEDAGPIPAVHPPAYNPAWTNNT
ncbi:hypothetical protein AcW1_006277 [Taiwanofungus camphoratus]|nr:hypothetical protein AcW2_005031 [Antrodia cinnamomea]KAI0958099.1 hypothetical protein AcW1_006277 [Antrodia cinnamomea]